MQFKGSVAIDATREDVWAFLTDPHAVSKCAPGLQSMKVIEPNHKFRAIAAVGFGTVKATFTTDVEWLELDELNRAKMKAHGSAPGSAVDAIAEMQLSDGEGGTTLLDWSAEVTIVGTIASLASRLMSSVTKKLTSQFFDCVKRKIEA